MDAPSSSDNGNPIHAILRALRHRNYRLFFSGQILSLIGTWITVTTTAWLVYQLSHSALMLGVVGFAGQLPAFVLAPAAGVYVDRWNRHRLLVVTQTLSMLQSFALAGLTLTGHITIPLIVALNGFQGLVNAFDMPGRQSFVIAMIEDKRDLGNAIALNSSMFNAARLIGPSTAGFIIATVGAGWAYLIDAVSYLAVLVALLAMRVPAPATDRAAHEGPFQAMHAGWRYIVGSLPIRSLMLLLALVSLVGGPYTVLMPIFATRVLGGGSYTLGLLLSAIGCGALIGALWLAARRSVLGLGRLIPIATVVFGCGLIGFAFSRSLWLSLPILVVSGAGFMLQMGREQYADPDDRRRPHARARDGILHDGFSRHCAVWQSLRWGVGGPHRGSLHSARKRALLHSRCSVVCAAARDDPCSCAPDLRRERDSAGGDTGSASRFRRFAAARRGGVVSTPQAEHTQSL